MAIDGWRYRAVAGCLTPQWQGLLVMLVLQVAQSLATLWLPHLSADVVNLGVGRDDRAYVIHTGTVMLSLSVLQVVLAVGASVVGARLAMRYGCDLRARDCAHVQAFSLHEMNRFGMPSLITRSTNDVLQLQTVLRTGRAKAVSQNCRRSNASLTLRV